MANISMACHHSTPALMADSINVTWEIQPGGRLWLRYFVECDLYSLIIPEFAGPERVDGLWNSTCFELFLRDPDDSSYLEFNFAPSSQWAAYRFRNYREEMTNWQMPPPEIYCDMSDTSFALEAIVALPDVLNIAVEAALSAVIHETGDIKSYWALHHAPGKPDFHHPDCFRLRLTAPAQP